MNKIILWHRNDLRLQDHPGLNQAVKDADKVVPVFVLSGSQLSGKFSSSNRNRFLLECLADLKQAYKERGADLVILQGEPEKQLAQLAAKIQASAVYYTIDVTPFSRSRDKNMAQKLANAGIRFKGFPGRFIVDSFSSIQTKDNTSYTIFTPFYKSWQQQTRRRALAPPKTINFPSGIPVGELPRIEEITRNEELSPFPLSKGGEKQALQQFNVFLGEGLVDYELSHNDVNRNTSLLSPYLHFGCISPRYIESNMPDGKNAQAFKRQLCWRDFYHYVLLHNPKNRSQEFREYYRKLSWPGTAEHLQAWKDGKTGFPIVDAAMRQLKQTGWMHNRSRLIVGSFLTKTLGIDWREGEAHFMKYLLDGDEANNNGNWQWIASVGVDPSPVFQRIYNPILQQQRHDPTGEYVKRFVAELRKIPIDSLAEPWELDATEQTQYSCTIGKDYPGPIVDHKVAREAALERYRQAKQG